MIGSGTNILTWLSVTIYGLILQAYPYSFRREFGASMRQVFRDAVRDACKQSGLTGLALLWMRTVADFLVSLFAAYVSERRDAIFKLGFGLTILYVCALAATMGLGAIKFSEFYQPSAFSRFGAPNAQEDVLLAAYEQALAGEFGRYRMFALGAGLVLAVLAGAASALFGLWQKSLLHGAGAFLGGTVFTIAAVSLLPTIWFPLDRYPVSALWLMGGGFPMAACTWLLVTAIGRLGSARASFKNV